MPARRDINLRRVYDHDARGDTGYRVLVDRLWPRGVTKADAALDEWLKDRRQLLWTVSSSSPARTRSPWSPPPATSSTPAPECSRSSLLRAGTLPAAKGLRPSRRPRHGRST